MANENEFTLKVITPERIFYEGQVTMVEFNTVEGEIGVYKNHIPLMEIISPGVLTITEAEEKKKAALHSGFAQILQDEVTILAEVVEWPDEIDAKRAEASKERAENRLQSRDDDVDVMRAQTALGRAMARINVIR